MNQLSSSSPVTCGHWFVRHGTCLACKTKPNRLEGRSFNYLFSGLRLSHEAVSFTKHLTTLMSLYGHKKLHLVLDLYHTLVHARDISTLSEAEKYLIEEEKTGSKRCLRRFNNHLIKFRPFLNEFLRETNKLFNMYVYIKGHLSYAQAVARMIDPNETYFGNRVISRRESPNTKTLDLVLADERGVLIVDDTVDVWPDHRRNLLQISRYFYFKTDCMNKESKLSYAERKRDESRGRLANILKSLKEVHNEFFSFGVEEELDSKDVRSLINGPFKPHGC